MKKEDIFETISPNEALEILKQITSSDMTLKKRVIELAETHVRQL